MVGEPCHLVRRVADVDDGQRQFAVQAFEIGQDFQLALQIERGQRLIHQQDLRRRQQGAGNRHALALAAGKFARRTVEQGGDAEQFGDLGQRKTPGCGRRPFLAEFHVAAYREVREQAGFLEDDAEGTLVRRHEAAAAFVLPDLAAEGEVAGRGAFQPCHGAQQGGLAGTGMAEQRGDAMAGQGQIDREREIVAVDAESGLNFRAHKAFRRVGLKVYSASSTRKLNSTMPPASQCACAYSSASTWS